MSDVQVIPWPTLGAHRDVAMQIAKRIRAEREDTPPSVEDEEHLQETVTRHVERLAENSGEYGVAPTVAASLNDTAYKEAVIRATMVEASMFEKLARLIYLLPGIEEIHCYSYRNWDVEFQGHVVDLDPDESPFANDQEVIELLRRIMNLDGTIGDSNLDDEHPIAECVVGTIARVSCSRYPVVSRSDSKVQAAIRLPKIGEIYTLDQYVERGNMPQGVRKFLEVLVTRRLNVLIAGGTGSGKTTLLRVMCGLIPDNERICVIENASELHLESMRWKLVANEWVQRPWVARAMALATVPRSFGGDPEKQTMGDLLRASLRYTPVRIILGEARGSEAADCLEAMNTGHEGSMMTVHANSVDMAIERMVTLVMKHPDIHGNDQLARRILASALEIVVHLKRDLRTGERKVSGVMALDRNGNQMPIYATNVEGVLERKVGPIEQYPQLAERLAGAFDNDEFPRP